MARYRVVQWSTGNIGRRALGILLDRDDFDVVGVHAFGSDKVGRDAGVLAGRAPDRHCRDQRCRCADRACAGLRELHASRHRLRAGGQDAAPRHQRGHHGRFPHRHPPPGRAPGARGGGATGTRDLPGNRIRAGLHQCLRRLPHRRLPTGAQRQARRNVGLHHLPRAGSLDSARIRQATASAGDANRPGDATIRPRLLRDAGHDRRPCWVSNSTPRTHSSSPRC